MAAVTASVVFTTARTLLNDDAGTLFTDAVLLPKLVQAYRQMMADLRINAQDLLITTGFSTVAAGTALLTFSDINEPIILWEKLSSDGVDKFVKMTEYDPLPNALSSTTLKYWQWDGAQMNFIAATTNRTVKAQYWRVIPEPTSGASSLYFINAEYYLAPVTAGIMAGVLGEAEQMETLIAQGVTTLKMIVDANRGRQVPPGSSRP